MRSSLILWFLSISIAIVHTFEDSNSLAYFDDTLYEPEKGNDLALGGYSKNDISNLDIDPDVLIADCSDEAKTSKLRARGKPRMCKPSGSRKIKRPRPPGIGTSNDAQTDVGSETDRIPAPAGTMNSNCVQYTMGILPIGVCSSDEPNDRTISSAATQEVPLSALQNCALGEFPILGVLVLVRHASIKDLLPTYVF